MYKIQGGEVSSTIQRNENTIYTALVPNQKGLESALENGYRSVAVFTAASETFSQKNTNCSIEESLKRFETMIHLWEENQLRVRAYISTCWICPYEGNVDAKSVVKVIQELLDLGVHEISLGDTIGKANPVDVEYLLDNLWIVGSPEDAEKQIRDLYHTVGGFGVLLAMGHEWEPKDQWINSMSLLAQEVMPNLDDL